MEVTEVSFVGDKTVTVTLNKGTYTYQCDPHASSGMKGTFEVT
jgi:plastocyanin